MKNILFKIGLCGALMTVSFACSQKTETTAPTVEKDSATVAAEKKKAQDQEKAALPKPYDPKENAELKIAELVKQAQAENKNTHTDGLERGRLIPCHNWTIW